MSIALNPLDRQMDKVPVIFISIQMQFAEIYGSLLFIWTIFTLHSSQMRAIHIYGKWNVVTVEEERCRNIVILSTKQPKFLVEKKKHKEKNYIFVDF